MTFQKSGIQWLIKAELDTRLSLKNNLVWCPKQGWIRHQTIQKTQKCVFFFQGTLFFKNNIMEWPKDGWIGHLGSCLSNVIEVSKMKVLATSFCFGSQLWLRLGRSLGNCGLSDGKRFCPRHSFSPCCTRSIQSNRKFCLFSVLPAVFCVVSTACKPQAYGKSIKTNTSKKLLLLVFCHQTILLCFFTLKLTQTKWEK